MFWGARLLARAAAVILLLELSTGSTAATLQRAVTENITTNAAVVAASRHKRESDTLKEVLIEHVNNVDQPQAALSLFIGFLILGAIVLVVLIFLGCLLLLRLSESQSAKYHRLCSQESLGSCRRSRTDNIGPSQVFTYVDLSNADGGGLNHRDDCEYSQAPRFSAIFTTVNNASAKGTESRRELKRRRSSGARTSRLVAMGLPSVASAVDTPSFRRVRSQNDSVNSPDMEYVSAAERATEPPKKRVCVQRVTGMPTQRSGSVRTAQGFETYGERCTELECGVPQMEVKVRDRVVKRYPHGAGSGQEWSPMETALTRRTDETTESSTTLTHNRYYPEGTSAHGSDSSLGPYRPGGSWSVIMSPLLSPDVTETGAPLFFNRPNAFTSSDNAPEGNSQVRPQRMELSGHGRLYEQHVPAAEGHTAAKADAKSCLGSSTDSDLVPYGSAAVVPSEGTLRRPDNALERTIDIEPENLNGVPTQSSKSEIRNLLGNEASDVKHDLLSSGKPVDKSTPSMINANVTLQRVPSQGPSTLGSPLHSEPRELSVQLPEMIAYFDRPQMAKSFKATNGGSSASNLATKVSSPDAQSITQPGAEGSLSRSASDNRTLSRKLRLPQPPIEPRGELQAVPPPREESAIIARSPPSALKHRDDQSSTQSHSLDDVSHQRASLLHTLSGSEMRSVDVEKRNVFATMSALAPRSEFSLVAPDSKPSGEMMLAVNDARVESLSNHGLAEISHFTADTVAKAPDKNEQLLSVSSETTTSEQSISSGSPSTKLTAGEVGQAPGYFSNLQLPKGSTPAVGAVEEDVHAKGLQLHEDPTAPKAEVTADGAWPIVAAEGKHIQPFDLNQAIVEGTKSGDVVKRDHNSATGSPQSSAIVCAPDKQILDKNNTQPPEREFNEGESKLTPVTLKTEQRPERTERRQLLADPVHRATIEPPTELTRFLKRNGSQGSLSGEFAEQPTLPSGHISGQTSSESATKASAEISERQTELVPLSTSLSQTDGTIAQLKPSQVQVSGISGALATSGETDLNVTPSGASAGSRELATSAAHQAKLMSPSSSQADGTVVEFKPSEMQVSGISRTMATSGNRDVDVTSSDASTGSRELATSAAHQAKLVSPSSSQADGTIVEFKPSETQVSGISRTMATSGNRDVDVTLSGTSAGSHELATTAAHQATLASPTSSLNGGVVDLVDQSRSSAHQAAESSRGLAVGGTSEVNPITDDATAQKKIYSGEQLTQDTTAATRENQPGP